MRHKIKKLIRGDFPEQEINRLAFPAIIASIAEPLISLGDNMIIGTYSPPGENYIGAVSLASSLFLTIVWVFAQTRTAISALIARFYGEKRLDEMRTLVPQVIFMNFLLGLFFYLITTLFASEIFSFYNAKGRLHEIAVEYYSIRALGLPLSLATYLIFGVFRGIQNTYWAMVIALVGGFVNLFLDLILMGGVEGWLNSQGIKGIAWASVAAQLIMLLLAIGVMYKKTIFRLNFLYEVNKQIYTLLAFTGNLIIRSLSVQTAYFFSNRVAAGAGDMFMNVQGVFFQIWLFAAFVVEGYCSAGNALAGKFYGEKNHEMLWRLGKFMSVRTLLIGLGLGILFLMIYPWVHLPFLTDAKEIELFQKVFWVVIIVLPLNAYAFVYDEMLKGMGRMAYLRDTLLMSTFLGFVPTVLLLEYMDWHLYAVWLAFVVWMIFRGTRLMLYFNRNFHY
jgi:putative MATE family efflux protein